MNEESHIDLRRLVGKKSNQTLSLNDQMQWASSIYLQEPRFPSRSRHYKVITDHAIQWDWLKWNNATSLLDETPLGFQNEKNTKELELQEILINLGCSDSLGSRVDFWLNSNQLLDRPVGEGSRNMYFRPAMTSSEFQDAFDTGLQQAKEEVNLGPFWTGVQLLNPASSVHAAIQLYIHAGVSLNESLKNLIHPDLLESVVYMADKSFRRHPMSFDPITSITFFGGYDLAFAVGFVCGMAQESRFCLLGGLQGYAIALLAETIQTGSSQFVTHLNAAPKEWKDENQEAFEGPFVFSISSYKVSNIQFILALEHLNEFLIQSNTK